MQNLFGMNRMAPRLALLLLLTLLPTALLGARAQTDDRSASTSPLQQALQVARDLMEEELGRPMNLARWRFYEDNWGSAESFHLYGSYGIDNCTDSVPVMQKRSKLLFGYTFSIQDVSGRELQARVSYNLVDAILCDEVIVPPAFGGPASAAEPAAPEAETAAPAPVVGAGNVAGFELGGHIAGFDATAASHMQRAGMTWVKKQVRHGISDGRDLIAQARNHGFKVLLGALGSRERLEQDFDGYIAEFAQYVAFLASNGAHAIEVWNEPNISREWPNGQISGSNYVRMLSAAYQAIKAANPATIVISGAPSPTGFSATGCQADGCNDDVFVRQMAQAGAANFLDCVGVHYNAGSVPPDATSGAPVGSAGHYSWYLPNTMNVYRSAFPNKPLCFTELGYLTGEGYGAIPQSFAWAAGNTLAEQAQWLAGAVNVARASGYVSLLIVWNVNFHIWGADPQAGYAIIRPGGSCPACDTLGQVMGGGGIPSQQATYDTTSSCTRLREQGSVPAEGWPEGHPMYTVARDRDRDGRACEQAG